MMEKRPAAMRKLEDMALIACFILAILLPGIGMLLKMDTAAASQENRQMSPFPPLSLDVDELRAFPKRFNLYFNDHFGFRSAMIRGVAIAKVQWLNVSSSANVVCGKAGWLFYAGEGSVTGYRGAQPFSEEQLESWKQALEGRRRWLAQRNIRYIFTVAPDKHSIYPEYMPDHIGRVGESRLDQLIRYLKENSEVEVLDLRPALLSAKDRHPLYYKTDTHWNDYGAFLAYQEISRAISKTLPAIRPFLESDFQVVTEQTQGKDLAGMLGLADVLLETTVSLRPLKPFQAMSSGRPLDRGVIEGVATFASEQKDRPLPRMVMERDSFANHLIPFLAEDFSRAVYYWDGEFQTSLIEQERPDIFLDEIVERKLMAAPPDDGLTIESKPEPEGEPKYEGSHDSASCEVISGWAWDSAHPDAFVQVDIYEDEKLLATVAATSFRADLRDAGKGSGHHAFVYQLPARRGDGQPRVITVKIAGTDISLTNTRRTLVCK